MPPKRLRPLSMPRLSRGGRDHGRDFQRPGKGLDLYVFARPRRVGFRPGLGDDLGHRRRDRELADRELIQQSSPVEEVPL